MKSIPQLMLASLLFLTSCEKHQKGGHSGKVGVERLRPTKSDRIDIRSTPPERTDIHDKFLKTFYGFMKAGASDVERADFVRTLEAEARARGISVMTLVAELVANAPDEPFQLCLLVEINCCFKDAESRLGLAAALPAGQLRSASISIGINLYYSAQDFDSGLRLYQGLPVGRDRILVAEYLTILKVQTHGRDAALEFARSLEMPEERNQAELAAEGRGMIFFTGEAFTKESHQSLDEMTLEFQGRKQ